MIPVGKIIKILIIAGKKIKPKHLKWILALPIMKDLFKIAFRKKKIDPKEAYTVDEVANLMKLKKMNKESKRKIIIELIMQKKLKATKILGNDYRITGQAILDCINSNEL